MNATKTRSRTEVARINAVEDARDARLTRALAARLLDILEGQEGIIQPTAELGVTHATIRLDLEIDGQEVPFLIHVERDPWN